MTFYRTSFLALLPQITFQFPFENPASFYLMALILGIIAGRLPAISVRMPQWGKWLAIALAVGLFGKALTQTTAKWIESQYNKDKNMMAIGCPMDRSNWRLCFFYSLALLDGAPAESLKNTQIQIWQRPFDFHAVRALGFYYISQNDLKNACEVTQVYDSFFKGKSYFSQFVTDNCKAIPNPVPFQNSHQFYLDYLRWMSKYVKE